jgi:hypothetical protein
MVKLRKIAIFLGGVIYCPSLADALSRAASLVAVLNTVSTRGANAVKRITTLAVF